jgi:hypothetical protein
MNVTKPQDAPSASRQYMTPSTCQYSDARLGPAHSFLPSTVHMPNYEFVVLVKVLRGEDEIWPPKLIPAIAAGLSDYAGRLLNHDARMASKPLVSSDGIALRPLFMHDLSS